MNPFLLLKGHQALFLSQFRGFLLTDGIYPTYSRFVKGMSQPVTLAAKKRAGWQSKTRKDIERAFGVLQQCFKFVDKPVQLFNPKEISARIAT